MLFVPKHAGRPDWLSEELRLAPAPTASLFADVIEDVCTRLPAVRKAGKAGRLDHLIEAGAWTDAALALIELELPGWQLRNLVYDDGEWHCSLSEQCNLPAGIDDTADAGHEILPLAILGAFFVARCRTRTARATLQRTGPRIRRTAGYAACCDNFV